MAEVKSRCDIEEKYKWKLEDIFKNDAEFEAAVSEVRALSKEFVKFRGRVGEGEKSILASLRLSDEIGEKLLSVVAYASMRRDEDNDVQKYRAMAERVGDLESDIMSECSFFEPGLVAAGIERIRGFFEKEPALFEYAHFFDNLFREQEHILDEKSERLLAMSSPVGGSAHDIFSSMNNADIKFGNVINEEGREEELTHSRYGIFLESNDRRVRKEAYNAMYAQYKAFKNTFASMYSGSIKSDLFYAKARGFESVRDMRLFDGNIPSDVYDGLLENVNHGLSALSEYLEMRKKVLGVDELSMYDLYVPIVPEDREEIPYEEAVEMVLAAVAPLGEDYVSDMRRAFSERWVDVYENRGKTSGAYSWGDNTTHPFVLLNYQGKIEDVFTLAHEMGHAMHSYYTNKKQPTVYRDYKIFVAEVASTVNENLLMEYLLREATGNRRAYLLGRKLEAIRTTFYRQTMFAEFESRVHGMYMEGTPLTAETLCKVYGEINKKYYGSVCVCDENITYEWARIPHFYTSFYVYQYATGFAAATCIKNLVLENLENARRYIEFLSGGNSAYPLNLLQGAGVDLTCADAVRSVVCDMEKTTKELGDILDK
ncbi:MAG: oligoendopeptidase F [Oscillospiraceae bacterium]|nr:oligoendopeptidase F [Oscillospiraceae bacterium]